MKQADDDDPGAEAEEKQVGEGEPGSHGPDLVLDGPHGPEPRHEDADRRHDGGDEWKPGQADHEAVDVGKCCYVGLGVVRLVWHKVT